MNENAAGPGLVAPAPPMLLDLVVLADPESPCSAAYLHGLRAAGFAPRGVLWITFLERMSRPLRPLYRWSPRWVSALARWRQRRTARSSADATAAAEILRTRWGCPAGNDTTAVDASVTRVGRCAVSSGFNDPALSAEVRAFGCGAALYTDGGRVPESFLRDCGIPVLHIHPGWVPDVRGSDGVLWSALVRGRLGYSAFFMDAGIDTGEILLREEYPIPRLGAWVDDVEEGALYRALLDTLDPHYRAMTLVRLAQRARSVGGSFAVLPRERQDPTMGKTYFSMHPRLRRRVLQCFR